MDKRTKILEYIILEYIKNPGPIGSEQLKLRLDLEISSATIRNYFKKLVEDGLLMQFHISGGRVPTVQALQEFWRHRLQTVEKVEVCSLERLDETCKTYKVPTVVRFEESNRVVNIYPAARKFLVLELEQGEVVLRYDEQMELFLKEFIGVEACELSKVAVHYRLFELAEKLDALERQNAPRVWATEELIEIAQSDYEWAQSYFSGFMTGVVIDSFESGFFFEKMAPHGYAVIKKDALIGTQNAHMLCIGHISRDFDGFFGSLH